MKLSLRPKNRTLACDLETPRFHLRSIGALETAWVTRSWRTDPEMLGPIFYSSRPRSIRKWLHHGVLPDGHRRFAYAIVVKETGETIGVHMIQLRDYRSASNTVGLTNRDWWGRDVVVEVRARLMNHFFQHGNVDRFSGRTDATNIASTFIYRRLGYAYIGTEHRIQHDPATGRHIDLSHFEIMRDEWDRGPFADTPTGKTP